MLNQGLRIVGEDSPVALTSSRRVFTRREFLKTMGVILGSAILPACTPAFDVPTTFTSTSVPKTATSTHQPTATSTITPTQTIQPTSTPRPMPLAPDGTFDFSRIEDYPELKDLNDDLGKFIAECQQRGLMRDFAAMPVVTELKLNVIDNRKSTNPRRWRDIATSFDPHTAVPLGTEPVHTIAGARFTMITGHTSETVLIIPVQYYVPDAVGKSVTVFTFIPHQRENWDGIHGLNKTNLYPALSGAFLPGILDGTLSPNSQMEYDAYLLHQLGVNQGGDNIMLQLWEERQQAPDAFIRLMPEAHLQMFSGETLPIKVQ